MCCMYVCCTVRVLKVSTSGYRLVACTCKSKQHVLIWVLQCYNSVLSNAGFIHVCLALFEGQVQWQNFLTLHEKFWHGRCFPQYWVAAGIKTLHLDIAYCWSWSLLGCLCRHLQVNWQSLEMPWKKASFCHGHCRQDFVCNAPSSSLIASILGGRNFTDNSFLQDIKGKYSI